MTDAVNEGVYGLPPESLVTLSPEAVQFSPLIPGAAALETCEIGSLAGITMLAPPGTLERRYAIALALKALAPGAPFTILALKDRGGSRLAGELKAFGCAASDEPKRHHRICSGVRPEVLEGIETALAEGGPRRIEPPGLWTQPGVFSWDRLDPGSALLMQHLPALKGEGADFGCGIGMLGLAVLAHPAVTRLTLVDLDRRAIEACRRNVADPRASIFWADLRGTNPNLGRLDFVVMNPPFHDGGAEDRALGQIFVRRAAETLRTGGRLWLTANRHLPYEAVLKTAFKTVTPVVEAGGYKITQAVR